MSGKLDPCYICEAAGSGICINNGTACECIDGYSGPTCLDSAENMNSDTTIVSITSINTSLNEVGIVAGVLAGILFSFFIGLVIFFFWKRRRNKKKLLAVTSSTSSTPTTTTIIVPALYDIAISTEDSSTSYGATMTYHIYEDLP